jgi:hypothetical protein
MKGSSDEATLIFDAGHLHFGGADVMDSLDKWGDRIRHVHFKDVREDVARQIRAENKSFFYRVVGGVFTVSGDRSAREGGRATQAWPVGAAGRVPTSALGKLHCGEGLPDQGPVRADHVKTSNRGRNSICGMRTALDVMCQNERLIGTNHELMENHGCQCIQ